MELRTCLKSDHASAIDLICRTFKPPMFEEFPLLLGLDNLAHRWIASDQGKVVAAVNYYTTPVILDRSTLIVASIGAVCTDEAYRGQGLASQLLEKAEQQMKNEGVAAVIISGDRPLYLRFGAALLQPLLKFTIPSKSSAIKLVPYNPNQLDFYFKLYQTLPYRFQRTPFEMKHLIEAVLTPDPWWDNYFYGIEKNNQLVAYLVFNHEKSNTTGALKEYAGDLNAVYEAMQTLTKRFNFSAFYAELPANDPLAGYLMKKNLLVTHEIHHSTIKIIHYNLMIQQLENYWVQQICSLFE